MSCNYNKQHVHLRWPARLSACVLPPCTHEVGIVQSARGRSGRWRAVSGDRSRDRAEPARAERSARPRSQKARGRPGRGRRAELTPGCRPRRAGARTRGPRLATSARSPAASPGPPPPAAWLAHSGRRTGSPWPSRSQTRGRENKGGKGTGPRGGRGEWNHLVTERARSGGESPGPRAREGKAAPCGPGPGGSAPPSSALRSEPRGGEAASRGPGPEPTEDPQKPASPGRSGPVPPAAATEAAAVFIPRAQAAPLGAGVGGRPSGPSPTHAAPPSRSARLTWGARTPTSARVSAAGCRVGGLAEGRASLRKATSRPFLQCE